MLLFVLTGKDPVLLKEQSVQVRLKVLEDIGQLCHPDMAAVFDKLLPREVGFLAAGIIA
jgi:hypothetical protein